jgi:hypothetical protein
MSDSFSITHIEKTSDGNYSIWVVARRVIEEKYYPNDQNVANSLILLGHDLTAYNRLIVKIRELNFLQLDAEYIPATISVIQVPTFYEFRELMLPLTTHNAGAVEEVEISEQNCLCGGPHPLKISGLGNINSYTGNFPSPFQIMNYTPSSREEPLLHQIFVPDTAIRRWIREAAEYHEIPHEMIAVIIQQENAPSASKFRQFLQFGERTLGTIAAQLDASLWDIIPDRFADNSSGFMNMRRPTLRDTINYTKEKYGRELMPSNVANRIGYIFNKNVDNGIQGADWRADLYYGAAHIRQLINRVMGNVCSKGEITLEQVENVFKSYNGSSEKAEKYGKDTITLLINAANGHETLYFYEK